MWRTLCILFSSFFLYFSASMNWWNTGIDISYIPRTIYPTAESMKGGRTYKCQNITKDLCLNNCYIFIRDTEANCLLVWNKSVWELLVNEQCFYVAWHSLLKGTVLHVLCNQTHVKWERTCGALGDCISQHAPRSVFKGRKLTDQLKSSDSRETNGFNQSWDFSFSINTFFFKTSDCDQSPFCQSEQTQSSRELWKGVCKHPSWKYLVHFLSKFTSVWYVWVSAFLLVSSYLVSCINPEWSPDAQQCKSVQLHYFRAILLSA